MAKAGEVISHWHHSVENLSTSTLEFFRSIEKALAEKQVDVKVERVNWNEGGILTAKREYLRLGYGRFMFDISAFPFGKDFYFSWWLNRKVPSFAGLIGCVGFLVLVVVFFMSLAAGGLIKGTIIFILLLSVVMIALGSAVRDGASEAGDIIAALPYLGPIFERMFKPTTYYSEDTRIMFEETVHRVVLDVVKAVLTVNSMTPLTEEQAARKMVRT